MKGLYGLPFEETGFRPDQYYQWLHYSRQESRGYCGGCDYCCDRCLYDYHYCAICDDAVGHNHSHEETEE